VPRTVPRFDFRIELASATDVGLVRTKNDDAVLVSAEHALFGIADGMGGHAAGEVASSLALAKALAAVTSREAREALNAYAAEPTLEHRRAIFRLLRAAVETANDAVLEAGRTKGHEGMGTTLDLALLVRNRAFIAHVGDARVYLVRPTATLQLTQDHVKEVAGGVDPFDARRRSSAPLVNAIGMAGVSADTLFVDLARGDRLVLCTDGVHGALENEAQLSRLCSRGEPSAITEALLGHARSEGGQDNASAVVIEIRDRFVKRTTDAGFSAADLSAISSSPLLADLPPAAVLGALAAGVEVELSLGERLPREVASDLAAYLIVEGLIQLADGRTLGPPGLVFAESLVGVRREAASPEVVSPDARVMRIRNDDFTEVCTHDPALGSLLYMRLARYLASVAPG
jgi:PPM family protein phosphatase